MKSDWNSLFIIAALGLALTAGAAGCSQSTSAEPATAETAQAETAKDSAKGTNCVECATPGSRAAMMQQAVANFEPEAKPAKE